MRVYGVWFIPKLPDKYVAERDDGILFQFEMYPFRRITDHDIQTYVGLHPQCCKGQPIRDYLYHFYGLIKNDENAMETINMQVTLKEKLKIETYAANFDPPKTISEVIREWIESL